MLYPFLFVYLPPRPLLDARAMASDLRPTTQEHWKELFNLINKPGSTGEERLLAALRYIGSLKRQGFAIDQLGREPLLDALSMDVFRPFLYPHAISRLATAGCALCRDVRVDTRVSLGHLVGRIFECAIDHDLASEIVASTGTFVVLSHSFRIFRRARQMPGWVLLFAAHYPLHANAAESARILRRLLEAAPSLRATRVAPEHLLSAMQHCDDPASMVSYWTDLVELLLTGEINRFPISMDTFLGEYSVCMTHLQTPVLHGLIRTGLARTGELLERYMQLLLLGVEPTENMSTFASRMIRLTDKRTRGAIQLDTDLLVPNRAVLFVDLLTPAQQQAHLANPNAPIPYPQGTELDVLLTPRARAWALVDILAPAALALPFAEIDDAEFPPTRDVRRPDQIYPSLQAHAWEVCRMMPVGIEPWVVVGIVYESMPKWINPVTGKTEFLDMSPMTAKGKTQFQLALYEFAKKVLSSFAVVRNRRSTQEMRTAALQVTAGGAAAGSSSYRKRAQQQQDDEEDEEEGRHPRLSTASAAAPAAAAASNPYLLPSVEDVEMEDDIGPSVQRAPSSRK